MSTPKLFRQLSSLGARTTMVKELPRPQRAVGLATVMAIGTATPPTWFDQNTYPDYYFKITNSEHMVELKQKFKRICEKSMIRKRHMYLTEEHLKENPSFCASMAASLDARQKLLIDGIPKLGQEAAQRAIDEWGHCKSKITHLIFCTVGGLDMPGADYQLTRLLGLSPSVKRLMVYFQGCFAGGTGLRLAKDIAENNKGARVLVVCSEIMTANNFKGPSEEYLDGLVGQAIFGDGAAAIIVGADPIQGSEKPLFELVSADQTIIPDSYSAINAHLREAGLVVHLQKDLHCNMSKKIEKRLEEGFQRFGISDWNSIFWVLHPGMPAIFDKLEHSLGLMPERLRATRLMLQDYGNMSSASVYFILEEMRNSSIKDGFNTTGGGLEWGVLFGFGPGFTIETVVLRSAMI